MILRGDYQSDILHTTVNIQFIIPQNLMGPYRVVYLLHGLHGNQGTWIDCTMLPNYAKEYNAVFVMPEAGRSFYFDLKIGRKYFTFISDELPQICRKIFNISTRREDTAVMGCSMGGNGSLKLSLGRPNQFGFCGAISSACIYFKEIVGALRADASTYLATGAEAEENVKDIKAAFGEDMEYRFEGDIPRLVKNFPADMPRPKIYSVCGTEDSLLKENHRFREEMKATAFDFTYEEWSGGHDWYFFNDALKKSLDFWYNS